MRGDIMCVLLISCRSRLSRLEGFEWTLHSGERQLTETSEWLLTAFELRWKAGYDF